VDLFSVAHDKIESLAISCDNTPFKELSPSRRAT